MKNISFGKYFPGESVLHKMDPRIKVIYAFIMTVALFCANNYIALVGLTAFIIFILVISHITLSLYLKALKPIFFLIFFTAVMNLFYSEGKSVFNWQFINITEEGINNSLFIFIRLFNLMLISSVLMFTTSHTNIMLALEYIMKPLSFLKINVSFIAMTMTIAIRFIPILKEEMNDIIKAQKSKGVIFNNGGLIKKAKCFLPILIPLFVLSLKKAYELSFAMESRCYVNNNKKSHLRQLKLNKFDLFAVFIMIITVVGVILCNMLFQRAIR